MSNNWKGEKVSYAVLHKWVKKKIHCPKPFICEICNGEVCKNRFPELTNKGEYVREGENWEKNWCWAGKRCNNENPSKDKRYKKEMEEHSKLGRNRYKERIHKKEMEWRKENNYEYKKSFALCIIRNKYKKEFEEILIGLNDTYKKNFKKATYILKNKYREEYLKNLNNNPDSIFFKYIEEVSREQLILLIKEYGNKEFRAKIILRAGGIK